MVDGARVRAARRSCERGVVEHHRYAVGGEAYVELDAVCAFTERLREGLERVLGRPALPAPAPMAEDDQTESSSASSFMSFCARSF